MNSQSISFTQGSYNPAGISRVFYAFAADILSFPTLADPATASTLSSLVEYTNAIVMKPGKYFNELYCTLETGEIKSTMVGPRDGKGYEVSADISFPGNESTYLGFKAFAANVGLVLLVLEKNKKVRVVGNLDDTAYIDADAEASGKKISDSRASVLTIKASGSTPAPIYTLDYKLLLAPANNTAPVVVAGPAQVLAGGATIATLAASATIANGTIVSRTVTQISGPNAAGITSPVSFTTGFTGLVPGVYIFRAIAVGSNGQIGSDDVQITAS